MSKWLDDLKYTMSLDVARSMSAGLPPKAIIDRLFLIPEQAQGAHLRENRRRPLAIDPETDEERQEIVDALERVAAWLEGGGSDEQIAEKLREIAAAVRG